MNGYGATSTQRWPVHLIGLMCCAAVSALGYLYGVEPILVARTQYASEQWQLAYQRELYQHKSTELTQLQERLTQIGQSLAQAPYELQSFESFNQRLSQLTQIASKHTLQVRAIVPGEVSATDRFMVISIQLTGKTSYKGCAGFLHEMHQAMPDMAVVALDLSGRAAAGAPSEQDFFLQMVWYAAPVQSHSGR